MARAMLLSAWCVLVASAASSVTVCAADGALPMRGDTREHVVSLLGNPQGTITIASKEDEILCYGDVLIEFVAGRVSRISGVGHRERAVLERASDPLAASSASAEVIVAAPSSAEAEAGSEVSATSRGNAVGDHAIGCDVCCPTVSVVVIEYRDREPRCGGRAAGTSFRRGAHGRDHGRHGGTDATCASAAPRAPVALSTFPLDVVRRAPDPRQQVFDLPDPRMAVLTAPDPRWRGDER